MARRCRTSLCLACKRCLALPTRRRTPKSHELVPPTHLHVNVCVFVLTLALFVCVYAQCSMCRPFSIHPSIHPPTHLLGRRRAVPRALFARILPCRARGAAQRNKHILYCFHMSERGNGNSHTHSKYARHGGTRNLDVLARGCSAIVAAGAAAAMAALTQRHPRQLRAPRR